MAKATPHTAADNKRTELVISAKPNGGFTIIDPNTLVREDFGRVHSQALAAFTTLDDALAWVRANLAQPAIEAQR